MPLRRFVWLLSASVIAVPLTLVSATTASPGQRIDAVASKYRLWGSSFELGSDNTARVRLDYIYPTYTDGSDSDRGPGARVVEVPGLTYDATSRSVVYTAGESRATCAEVHGAHRLRATGQCRIEAHVVHPDRGDSHGRDMLDVFLHVARQ